MKVDFTEAQLRVICDVLRNGCRGFRYGDHTTPKGRVMRRAYENIKEREAFYMLRDGRLPRRGERQCRANSK